MASFAATLSCRRICSPLASSIMSHAQTQPRLRAPRRTSRRVLSS